MFRPLYLALLALFWSQTALAYPKPMPGKFVHDFANVIPADVEARMEARLRGLENDTTTQVVVVTVETTNSEIPKSYTKNLMAEWGVGQVGVNNGVMLLNARKERGLSIKTGSGLKDKLTNGMIDAILADHVVPKFKSGKDAAGLEAGTEQIIGILNGTIYAPSDVSRVTNESTDEERTKFIVIIIVIVLLIAFLSMFTKGGSGGSSGSGFSSSHHHDYSSGSSGGSGFGGGDSGGSGGDSSY